MRTLTFSKQTIPLNTSESVHIPTVTTSKCICVCRPKVCLMSGECPSSDILCDIVNSDGGPTTNVLLTHLTTEQTIRESFSLMYLDVNVLFLLKAISFTMDS